MPKRILRGALPMVVTTAVTILAAACALPRAHADIYTWTDESGRVNISNLAPPEGARVKTDELWDLVNYVRSLARKKPSDDKTAP